jgi:hypothetical protein
MPVELADFLREISAARFPLNVIERFLYELP